MQKIAALLLLFYSRLQSSRFAVLWVFVLSLLYFGMWEWCRPLLVPDEGRYVGVAWEMLRSHEFWTPTLNGLPYFHKPPLFYWLTAASLSLFGLHDWAGRIAPLLGALLGVCSVFWLVRRWQNSKTATLMFGLMLIQSLIFLGAQYANLDMLVTGCVIATIVALAHVVLSARAGLPYRRPLTAAYFLAGLGFLAKGLIGLVLPAAVILVWLIVLREWRLILLLLRSKAGWLLLALTVLPWSITMQWRFSEFFHYFIIVQHFDRFAQTGFNNAHPWWFYLAILLVAGAPFWYAAGRQLFSGSLNMEAEHAPLRYLMWIWAAVVTLFFSLPASKLVGYILPAVFPLMYVAADAYQTYASPQMQRNWQIAALVWALVGVLVAVGIGIFPPHDERPLAQTLLKERSADQPIYMLGNYYFAVPFYARLKEPVFVVDNWHDPAVSVEDNVLKELADAGHFAPDKARQYLISPQDMQRRLCAQNGISWMLVAMKRSEKIEWLPQEPLVRKTGDGLWKIDSRDDAMRKRLGCDLPIMPFPLAMGTAS